MADAAGDIFRSDGMIVEDVYSKENTAVNKGDAVVFDTNGYAPGQAATVAEVKAYIALDTKAAVAATRVLFTILRHGYGRVAKDIAGGALYQGDVPTFANDGDMTSGGNAAGGMTLASDAVDADTFYEVFIS